MANTITQGPSDALLIAQEKTRQAELSAQSAAAKSSVGAAISRGLAKRVEGVAAGGSGAVTTFGKLEHVATVAASGIGTTYFNRSRPAGARAAWMAAEILIGGIVATGAKDNSSLSRVAAGVVTGAAIDLLTGAGNPPATTGGQVDALQMLAPQATAAQGASPVRVRVRVHP